MKPIGVGVIGLGVFGERHLEIWSLLPTVRVAAVCSRTPERAAELALRFGAERWYTDYRDLVSDPAVQVVDVCTRDFEHVGPAVAAAEAGRHLFLEKPIGTSLEDGERILSAVEKAGVLFMVGHVLRFDERHRWLKRCIGAGELGRIASMHLKRNVSRRQNYTGRSVSPFLGAQVHDIDLALWFSGERPTELYSVKNHSLGERMPDVAWTILRFQSGLIATIQTVWLLPLASPRSVDASIEVNGTKGTVHMDSADRGVDLWSDERAVNPDTSPVGGVAGEALRAELAHFADCVHAKRRSSLITTQEAWQAFRVACLAMEGAEQGIPVKLSE